MKYLVAILVIVELMLLSGCYYQTEPVLLENNGIDMSVNIPLYSVNPDELFKEFEDNTFAAEEKYLYKYIEVNGSVGSVWRDLEGPRLDLNVALPFRSVACYFDDEEYVDILKTLSPGDKVTVKGYLAEYRGDFIFIKTDSVEKCNE